MGKHLYLGRMGGVDAPTKLRMLRQLSKELNIPWKEARNHYKYPYGYDYSAYNPWLKDEQTGKNTTERWVENTLTAGLRWVGYCDEIVDRIRHTGWYTDEFQDGKYRGAVWQLPAKNSKERFVYGYEDNYNPNAAYIDFAWTDDKDEAARWADGLAERNAEEAREFYALEGAKVRLDEIKKELKGVRADIIQICKEAREACVLLQKFEAIKAAAKERVKHLLHQRSDLFNERDKLEEEFPEAVEQ